MYVPFAIIKAAKECDGEAADFIFRHFKGYIASKCQVRYIDEYGKNGSYIDEDLRYRAEAALLSAIFTFQFREPPEDFAG